jgi:hypothetical protein
MPPTAATRIDEAISLNIRAEARMAGRIRVYPWLNLNRVASSEHNLFHGAIAAREGVVLPAESRIETPKRFIRDRYS